MAWGRTNCTLESTVICSEEKNGAVVRKRLKLAAVETVWTPLSWSRELVVTEVCLLFVYWIEWLPTEHKIWDFTWKKPSTSLEIIMEVSVFWDDTMCTDKSTATFLMKFLSLPSGLKSKPSVHVQARTQLTFNQSLRIWCWGPFAVFGHCHHSY